MTSKIIARIRRRQAADANRRFFDRQLPGAIELKCQIPVMTGATFSQDVIVNGQLVKAGTKVRFETP